MSSRVSMAAAVRLLRDERYWLYKTWDLAESELAQPDAPTALLQAQMVRLADEIDEITAALIVLGDGARGARPAREAHA